MGSVRAAFATIEICTPQRHPMTFPLIAAPTSADHAPSTQTLRDREKHNATAAMYSYTHTTLRMNCKLASGPSRKNSHA